MFSKPITLATLIATTAVLAGAVSQPQNPPPPPTVDQCYNEFRVALEDCVQLDPGPPELRQLCLSAAIEGYRDCLNDTNPPGDPPTRPDCWAQMLRDFATCSEDYPNCRSPFNSTVCIKFRTCLNAMRQKYSWCLSRVPAPAAASVRFFDPADPASNNFAANGFSNKLTANIEITNASQEVDLTIEFAECDPADPDNPKWYPVSVTYNAKNGQYAIDVPVPLDKLNCADKVIIMFVRATRTGDYITGDFVPVQMY